MDASSSDANVILGDARVLPEEGVGSISLARGKFNGVYYVQKMKLNLLSSQEIYKQSMKIELYNDRCIVKDPEKNFSIVATKRVQDNFWVFENFSAQKDSYAFVASADDVSKLWHECLGHLNYRSINLINTLKMVVGLPQVPCSEGDCEG